MGILRDSIWQFIGVIVALITIGLSIYFFRKQQGTKRILCEILSNSLLVSVSDEIQSDIQVSYKGIAVQDIRLIILRLQNTGTIPISSGDFEEPIQLSLGQDSRILDVAIVENKPKSLHPQLFNESSILTIEPLLLNPEDSFTLKIIALKATEDLAINGRILGVKELTTETAQVFASMELENEQNRIEAAINRLGILIVFGFLAFAGPSFLTDYRYFFIQIYQWPEWTQWVIFGLIIGIVTSLTLSMLAPGWLRKLIARSSKKK